MKTANGGRVYTVASLTVGRDLFVAKPFGASLALGLAFGVAFYRGESSRKGDRKVGSKSGSGYRRP
jgi:hypothetical protein